MRSRWLVACAATLACAAAVRAAAPEDDLVRVLAAPLAKNFESDWSSVDKLRSVRWAPLPPKMLQNCAPDGGCFTREGLVEVGGRKLTLVATGARMMAGNFYFRNTGAAFGEAAVLAALKRAGYAIELKRCPVPGGPGGQNWYRLTSARSEPGHLAIQTSCKGQPCEGFAVLPGPELPRLQPNQLKMYSEQCSGGAAERTAVSTVMPHEQIAKLLVALMPVVNGPALYDWKALALTTTGITWIGAGPQKMDLMSFKNDPSPMGQSGDVKLSGRQFSVLAGGSATQVKAVYLDEGGLHPRGEDLLGVLRKQGFAVQLVRCGPVYTESINNWYRVGSATVRPLMLRQSLRLDGKQVQDTYALRFDGSLPARDPRDRDPGVNACK